MGELQQRLKDLVDYTSIPPYGEFILNEQREVLKIVEEMKNEFPIKTKTVKGMIPHFPTYTETIVESDAAIKWFEKWLK